MTAVTNIFKRNAFAAFFHGNDSNEVYYVVHPLYDEPEEKCDPEALGPLKLSQGERLSLFALRGYLILMLGLAAVRVAEMAGAFGPHLAH